MIVDAVEWNVKPLPDIPIVATGWLLVTREKLQSCKFWKSSLIYNIASLKRQCCHFHEILVTQTATKISSIWYFVSVPDNWSEIWWARLNLVRINLLQSIGADLYECHGARMITNWDENFATTSLQHEHHGVSNYRHIDCLLSSLFRWTLNKIPKLSHYRPLVRGIHNAMDSPHKGPVLCKAFPCGYGGGSTMHHA